MEDLPIEKLINLGAVILPKKKVKDPRAMEFINTLISIKGYNPSPLNIVQTYDGIVVAIKLDEECELRSLSEKECDFFQMLAERGMCPPPLNFIKTPLRTLIIFPRTYSLDSIKLNEHNLPLILDQITNTAFSLKHLNLYYSDFTISGIRFYHPSKGENKIVLLNFRDIRESPNKLKNMLKSFYISLGLEGGKRKFDTKGLEAIVTFLMNMKEDMPYSYPHLLEIVNNC